MVPTSRGSFLPVISTCMGFFFTECSTLRSRIKLQIHILPPFLVGWHLFYNQLMRVWTEHSRKEYASSTRLDWWRTDLDLLASSSFADSTVVSCLWARQPILHDSSCFQEVPIPNQPNGSRSEIVCEDYREKEDTIFMKLSNEYYD